MDMKNKAVLILVENLSVPFDRRVWLEARALKESGRTVTVLCPRFRNEKDFEVLEGVNIYRYSQPPVTKGILSYIFEFLYSFIMSSILSMWIFFRHGFDVIHACNPPDTFFVIGLFYKIFGRRFYFDQHDLCPEVYLAKYGSYRKDLLYYLLLILEFLTYRTADRVIVTNNSYRDIAISRGRLKEDKVFVVRTGPELERFKGASLRPALKQDRKYMVSYLGVMAPQDGVDYLLLAIDVVVNGYGRKDILFNLMGGGDSLNDLKKLKMELDLDGSVQFTGRIPDKELMEYLVLSDLCVAPDPKNPLNDKSTMNKILEYMAMARPIVSFDLKESRYSAGDSAVYARPNDIREFADRIIELLNDPECRERMGRIGYERLKGELSWAYNKDRLIYAYR